MSASDAIDPQVRALCDAGEFDRATTRVIERLGPEILGVLVAIAPDDATAADAYSVFCEQLWRSLPSFRFEASVRTWCYVLARRALVTARRAQGRGPQLVPVSPSRIPDAIAAAKSETQPHLKTTYKNQLRALRASLSDDEQLLLVLRLDREMPWDAIAQVLGEDPHAQPAELKRTAAALRKRFQRAKQKLASQLTKPAER